MVSAICNFRIFLGDVSLGSVLEPKSKSRLDVVFATWKHFWLFSWCLDFYCESALVSAIFGVSKMCDFSVRGRGTILCICGVGCYLFVAKFNRESALVSAIFWSPKCLSFRGWNVVQFCVFAALVAHLRMECIFELPKRISEPEFSLLGCSGKPIGTFSQPEDTRPPC